jgi:hypothetical protein
MSTVELEVMVVRTSDAAVWVYLDDQDRDEDPHVIPKSLIEEGPDAVGETGTMVVPEWFATKEGLV